MTVFSQNSFAGIFSSKKSASELPILDSLIKQADPHCVTILDPQLELNLLPANGLTSEIGEVSVAAPELTTIFYRYDLIFLNRYNPKEAEKFYEELREAIRLNPYTPHSLQRLIDEISGVGAILGDLQAAPRVSGRDWTSEAIHHVGRILVALVIARDLARVTPDEGLRNMITFAALKYSEPEAGWEFVKGPGNSRVELLTQQIAQVQNKLREFLKYRVIVRKELEGLVQSALGTAPTNVLFMPKDSFAIANSMFILVEALRRPNRGQTPVADEPLLFLNNYVAELAPNIRSMDREGLVAQLSNFDETLRSWNGKGIGHHLHAADFGNVTKVAGFSAAAAKAIRQAPNVPWQALMMLMDRDAKD